MPAGSSGSSGSSGLYAELGGAEGLSQDIEDRWLATDQAFRLAIVKESESEAETVMRGPGQFPVVVRRPGGYVAPALIPRS